MRNALKKVKCINCERQAPKEGYYTRVLFQPLTQIREYNIAAKVLSVTYASRKLVKTVSKKFEIRVPFVCESKNLIYVVICSACKEEYIGQTQTMLKERWNTYRQHIRQPELQQIDVNGYIRTYRDGYCKIMPLFAIREDNKILTESYETYTV